MNANDLLASHPMASAVLLHMTVWVLLLAAAGTTLLRMEQLPRLLRWLLGFPLMFIIPLVAGLIGGEIVASLGFADQPGWQDGAEAALTAQFGLAVVLDVPWLLWGLSWVTRIPAPDTGQPPWPAPQLLAALAKVSISEARTVVDRDGGVVIDVQTHDREGLPRVHRFRLDLDERHQRVCVVETLGPSPKQGPMGRWLPVTVLGLVDAARIRPLLRDLPEGVERSLNEMQAPRVRLRQLVARAGWAWQPLLHAPAQRLRPGG